VPARDDRTLFEFLTLEGAQAGLSWMTILRKRDGYRRAFASFDPRAVASFTATDVERLLADPTIVRNRAKITSTIENARAVLAIQSERGSLAALLWSFVDGEPLQPARRQLEPTILACRRWPSRIRRSSSPWCAGRCTRSNCSRRAASVGAVVERRICRRSDFRSCC